MKNIGKTAAKKMPKSRCECYLRKNTHCIILIPVCQYNALVFYYSLAVVENKINKIQMLTYICIPKDFSEMVNLSPVFLEFRHYHKSLNRTLGCYLFFDIFGWGLIQRGFIQGGLI